MRGPSQPVGMGGSRSRHTGCRSPRGPGGRPRHHGPASRFRSTSSRALPADAALPVPSADWAATGPCVTTTVQLMVSQAPEGR